MSVATVIASQALTSGTLSLMMRAVQLSHLRVRIEHTSSAEFGQVYLPAVNAGLMVICGNLVLAFRNSTNLAAAYGIAATSTMVPPRCCLNEAWSPSFVSWVPGGQGCPLRAPAFHDPSRQEG